MRLNVYSEICKQAILKISGMQFLLIMWHWFIFFNLFVKISTHTQKRASIEIALPSFNEALDLIKNYHQLQRRGHQKWHLVPSSTLTIWKKKKKPKNLTGEGNDMAFSPMPILQLCIRELDLKMKQKALNSSPTEFLAKKL